MGSRVKSRITILPDLTVSVAIEGYQLDRNAILP